MEVTAVENFRANVKAAMQSRGMTLQLLAQQIGSSAPYVCNILKENGNVPSLERCEQIANELGVSLSTLLRQPREKVA